MATTAKPKARRIAAPDPADPRLRELFREFKVERSAIDEAKRTVELSFASEAPVERWFGDEILECTPGACDMNRLNNGGALLLQHNPDDQVGVVEKAMVAGGKCRAVVRFSKSARAQEIFQDVCDGIRSLVSVGYAVKNMVLVESDDTDGDTYRVSSWEPYEISLVSIPADSSVGVGRSQPNPAAEAARNLNPSPPMEVITPPAAPAGAAPRSLAPEGLPESQRMSEIRAIGANFKVPQERVIKALAENETLDVFRQWVLETHLKSAPVDVNPNIGLDTKAKRRYSITRAISCIANNRPLDGLEREASDECQKKFRREAPPAGFIVPHDIAEFQDREMVAAMFRVNPALERSAYGQKLSRSLSASVFASGGALVGTELLGGSFIELLRNRTLLAQLGVGTMSGLVGNIAIPRQSSASTAYWLAEGDSITASTQGLAQVGATPHKLGASTAYSKQLLAQASIDSEAFVRDDQMRVLAIAKDLAGISGTGGKQPLGILNGPTGVGSITYGGTCTWAKVLENESTVFTANADNLGAIAFLMNITTRNKWKSIPRIAASTMPLFLVDDKNQANGYDCNVTNQILTTATPVVNQTIFGVWNQAMFCDWAGMDVVVDPYTQATSGNVVVTMAMWTDFIVRHWAAFCRSTDTGAA